MFILLSNYCDSRIESLSLVDFMLRSYRGKIGMYFLSKTLLEEKLARLNEVTLW